MFFKNVSQIPCIKALLSGYYIDLSKPNVKSKGLIRVDECYCDDQNH